MISKEDIQKISKRINLPEKEVEKRIRETLKSISKPSLHNIDTVYPSKHKYIGFSDE